MAILGAVATSNLVADTPQTAASLKSPLSAEDSLGQFELHPALKLELVAAEPDVIDPVAVAFDGKSRMWVVEMRDYPHGPQPGKPPSSRIRLLEDKDGDGRYESSHVFVDKLLFATGTQPWKGGVIVTLAGEVAYFRDTNNDGRADQREIWFSGFAQRNSQLRANHPTFALDNHLYIANGLRGGDVIAKRSGWTDGAQKVSISGMDFRFHPTEGTYEAVTGNGQFGLTFDDFGNRFVCSNRNPCRHIVMEDRYIRRNPFLTLSNVVHDVAPAGAASKVHAISQTWTTSNLHAGQFTAACGVTLYRGDALPEEFHGNCFVCEPTGNLVHRDILTREGATFSSQPGRKGIEFLASRDEWFRPVNLACGPDGALYVVDMYRAVIEHPQWVPDELKNRPDTHYGNDRGRIYRIVAQDTLAESQPRAPRLAEKSSAELVALLAHPNGWHRDTAARLIFEQHDVSVAPHLRKLAVSGPTSASRVHALWLLKGLGELAPAMLQQVLEDDAAGPRVCEQAVRLSEPWLATKDRLRQLVLERTTDGEARLQFQAVLSLGETEASDDVRELLARLALAHAGDRWMRAAFLSSIGKSPVATLNALFEDITKSGQWDTAGTVALLRSMSDVIGSRMKPDEIRRALVILGDPRRLEQHSEREQAVRVRVGALAGLGAGIGRRGGSLQAFLPGRTANRDANDQFAQSGVDLLFKSAIRLALSESSETSARQEAISLLQYAEYSRAQPPLEQLAKTDTNQAIRIAAIGSLAAFRDPDVGKIFLDDFTSQTPAVRRALLDGMLADVERTRLLLDEIAAGRIPMAELDPSRIARLAKHRDESIKKQAETLVAQATPADRREVMATYRQSLELAADPTRGQKVFATNCTACHRIGNLGVDVAPDISDSRIRKPEQILTDILDPNRAVDNNYFSYTIVTTQGKVLTGVIGAETASSVTLRQQENKSISVLRQDIEAMQSNGVSLMPVGLEKNISVEQMADLISFIKNWRYLDGRIPITPGS
jgi:putative membrane-bound dehydrogenase-like protein